MPKSTQGIVIANPATVELASPPFPSAWVIDGPPQARATAIAKSQDGAMTVIAWSCTRGCFRRHHQVDEMAHILSGEAVITDPRRAERRLSAGDTAFFPAGSTSLWQVRKEIRKIAVCRLAMPRRPGFASRTWNKLIRIGSAMLGLDAEQAEAAGGLVGAERLATPGQPAAAPSRRA
jgi:uncharacterized cupin superfamily protein